MNAEQQTESAAREDERPPFGTWTHWYLVVLLMLMILIILFYTFTRAFQ
jgi:hypothetical protein